MHFDLGSVPDYVGPLVTALVAMYLGYTGLIKEGRLRRSDFLERDRQVRREHHGDELREHLNAITNFIRHPQGLNEAAPREGLLHALRQLQVIGEPDVVEAAAEAYKQIADALSAGGGYAIRLDTLAKAVRDNIRSQLGLEAVEHRVPFRNEGFLPQDATVAEPDVACS